ncbi:DUF5313 family protein [Rhodococcus sp. NPDC059968]|uniref:DUF5313 family protein n=1 Tax=Rhodococcus sp. NPDC059968 TaxID=3347017 RepID=UPI00366FFA00
MRPPSRPSLMQQSAYALGRRLPDTMQDWVQNDLIGPGATVRQVRRFMLPILAMLSSFLLLPGPMWVPLAMMTLLTIPVLYFAVALERIYRRHRLLIHGLDPDLLNDDAQRRAEQLRADYESRHGNRADDEPRTST